MNAQQAILRLKVVTAVMLTAATAWASLKLGFDAVLLCAASTLIGYAFRHLTFHVRVKDLVERDPMRSVQRVDWSKELRP